MERGAFPRIERTFDDFVVAKLNVFGDDNPKASLNMEAIMKLVGDPSIPRYVVVNPHTEKVLRTWEYKQEFTSRPQSFAELMNAGRAVFEAQKSN